MADRLSGFDREIQKPWSRGWYRGVVVAEYETQGDKKYTFITEDSPSLDGNSRKVQICMTLANPNGSGHIDTKQLNYSVYYRPDRLFDPERIKEVAEIKASAPKKGAWNDKDAQRDYLSFVALHELEKALNQGKELEESEQGGLDVSHLVGAEADAFVSIYRKGIKNDKSITEEVPADLIKDYFDGKAEWGNWFYGIKYLDTAGSHTDKKK